MRIKTFVGHTAAVLSAVIALAVFLGSGYFAQKLVGATARQVGPQYTGGEIVRVIEHGRYKTLQHRALFDGLIGEKTNGFVQIDYVPASALPERITDDIDFDLDGEADFRLEYDAAANSAILTPYNDRVSDVEGCYTLRERRAVRVYLLNK